MILTKDEVVSGDVFDVVTAEDVDVVFDTWKEINWNFGAHGMWIFYNIPFFIQMLILLVKGITCKSEVK